MQMGGSDSYYRDFSGDDDNDDDDGGDDDDHDDDDHDDETDHDDHGDHDDHDDGHDVGHEEDAENVTSCASGRRRQRCGGVQQVCTRKVTSLRRSLSCNTIVTNVEVQDTDFLDTPMSRRFIILVNVQFALLPSRRLLYDDAAEVTRR